MTELLEKQFMGNAVSSYATAVLFFAAGLVGIMIFKKIVMSHLKKAAKKTTVGFDDFIIEVLEKNLVPILYYGAFYVSVQSLVLNKTLAKLVTVAGTILLTIYGIRFIVALIVYSLQAAYVKKAGDPSKKEGLKGIITFIKIIIWGCGIIFVLDNLGIEVKAAIAGLGISGIALAFASQAVLGDLFSYFAIFLDKPFEVGDFIIVGDFLGVVQKIGMKTTRVSSLSGEQLVFSNTDLTNSRIRNYKRMQKRRVVFKFGVIYQTTLDQIKKVPEMVKDIIKGIENTAFDRAHFQSFGNSSLDFEVVYYVLSADYNVYMDIQQEINVKLFEKLQEKNIDFAYPTQTLFVNMEKAS